MSKYRLWYLSSPDEENEKLTLPSETTCYQTTIDSSMLGDIEKINRQSSSISIHQLDQLSALIRAG